jgi:hypothetical protein
LHRVHVLWGMKVGERYQTMSNEKKKTHKKSSS